VWPPFKMDRKGWKRRGISLRATRRVILKGEGGVVSSEKKGELGPSTAERRKK